MVVEQCLRTLAWKNAHGVRDTLTMSSSVTECRHYALGHEPHVGIHASARFTMGLRGQLEQLSVRSRSRVRRVTSEETQVKSHVPTYGTTDF